MRIPQIIIIILYAMALGMALVNDGKVEQRKESFWKTLLSITIYMALLWWGGFFS